MSDVIRIDGHYNGKIIVTRYKRTSTRNKVKHCEQQIHVPSQFLFSPQKAIRCTLLPVSEENFSVQILRTQPRPCWASIEPPVPPSWIQWVSSKLKTLPQSYCA